MENAVTSAADVHAAAAPAIEAALLARLSGMDPVLASEVLALVAKWGVPIVEGILERFHLIPKA